VADLNAGTFGALGVLAALNHRHNTGEGQHVETSLLESAMAYTVWESGLYLAMGEIAERKGSRHRLAAPYEALKVQDGHVVVGVNSQSLWLRFCEAIGVPGLNDDERFNHPLARLANRAALREELEAILSQHPATYWEERLVEVGVPCGPIKNVEEALADPHIQARGLVTHVGERDFVGSPVKMSATPPAIHRGPAEVGQHTREVLLDSGFSAREIDGLVAGGAISESQQEKES